MKRKVFPLVLLLGTVLPALSSCGEADCEAYCASKCGTSSSEPVSTSGTPTSGEPVTSATPTYTEPTTASTSEDEPEKLIVPDVLTIHYHMDTPSYDSKRFYVWITGKNGVEEHSTGMDDFGMYYTCNPSDTSIWRKHAKFFFIIKNQGTWAGQSMDTEIPYDVFVPTLDPVDNKYKLEVWCIDGEAGMIETYATREETVGDRLSYAKFHDFRTIHITGMGEGMGADVGKVASYDLYALTQEYYLTDPDMQYQSLPKYLIKSGTPMSSDFDITLDQDIELNKVFMIKCKFVNYPDKIKSKNVTFEKLYATEKFKTQYNYIGDDLGLTYTKEKSTFKLWAPTSARVLLKVYFQGTPSALDDIGTLDMDWYVGYEMEYGANGVYSCSVEQDLEGYYYTYSVTNSDGTSEVMDPYARAAGINGVRAEIVDLSKTNPEGWSDVFGSSWDGKAGYDIESSQDLIVYETHVRDVTMHQTWTTGTTSKDEKLRGTYLGMIEKGTTYSEAEAGKVYTTTVKTGFDHIEEMGFNTVELLPVFDQDNDEREVDFNWGYNPLNYNVPEGGYSSNPYDGVTAIKELKQLVLAFANNENHTRICMDVVYNHVSSVSSNNLNRIVPKYFFRINPEGGYYDGSGCGNEVKTEAPMMRKFIVDSVKYWASEYGIKCFRFDLMQLIDKNTMKLVKDALYEIDHDIVVFGEPWCLGYNGEEPSTDKTALYNELYPSPDSPGTLGGFNDGGRDAIRGSNDSGWGNYSPYCTWGFMSQGGSDVGNKSENVAMMLKGGNPYCGGANPRQTINYVSCHDNYTAFDQLNYCLGPGGENPAPETEPNPIDVCKASLGAHGAVVMGQGVAFIQGGEELWRSKVQDLEQEDYEVYPYPDYPTEGEIYDNTHGIDTPRGAAGTLLGAQPCSDDVRMYGKVISHNSYKSNDKVNAYDYSRLINIETQGVKYSVYQYSEAFKELVNMRKYVGKYAYPDNMNADKVYVGNTGDSSTLVVGRTYAKVPGNKNLVFFMSGRNEHNEVANMDAKNGTLIWNSFGQADHSYSWTGSCTLHPAQYQFLIFEM